MVSTKRHAIGRMQAALTAFCFSLLGVFAKWAYAFGQSVGELLTFRFICAAGMLWVCLLVWKRKEIALPPKQIGILALLGVFGYASMSTTYFLALEGLSVTMAVLLLYTYPFWVGLMAHLFTAQKMKLRDLCSLLLAGVGLLLLLDGEFQVHSYGALALGLASAIIYALYILLSERFQKGVHPLVSSTYVITFGALALFLTYRPSLGQLVNLGALPLWNIIGVAFVCTVMPLTLELAALQKITGPEFSLIMMMEPFAAAGWGLWFFHDRLSLVQGTGALVIGAALALRWLRIKSQNQPAPD